MSEITDYPEYPVFKGLQRPLEFFGFRGRYIVWVAVTASASLLGFFILYALLGVLWGFVFALTALAVGSGFIFFYQQKGLYSKKVEIGVFVVRSVEC